MDIRSSNPAFRNGILTRSGAVTADGVMTLGGTIGKTLVLIGTAIAAAFYVFAQAISNPERLGMLMLIGVIGGLVMAIATTLRPRWAPVTAPLYAALEGVALGAISTIYNTRSSGLAAQAVLLTFAVFLTMLGLYRFGVIRATARFRAVVTAGAMGLMVFYLLSFVLGFFGITMPLVNSASPLGIGFSVVAAGLAAFFLILDFDLVEEGIARGAPKHMEWYAGFALLVTLVWLYLELIRLLDKLRR